VKFTPVRVVSHNTLTALGEGGAIRVRHDRYMAKGLDKSKSLLGLMEDTYSRLGKLFQAMVAEQAADEP
jgi:hypothetical protein